MVRQARVTKPASLDNAWKDKTDRWTGASTWREGEADRRLP